MNLIVVTDGHTLNPGDLSWKQFEAMGKIVVYDRTSGADALNRCKDATVIITNKTLIPSTVIHFAENLKLIAVTATGFNNVDIEAARQKQIPVCNVPGYGTDSVAQHTFALILELTNYVGKNSSSVTNGEWFRSEDWCYTKTPITELSGKTIGIIGFGKIGQKVAAIASAFGMTVIYHSNHEKSGIGDKATLDEVFAQSDIVSLHLPLKTDNHAFVNLRLISLMKPSAFLINTARGQLIHERDLADALKAGKIAGAALDVLSQEPPSIENPLIGLSNCIITPHNAWLSIEARKRIMNITCENVRTALSGNPQNIVNR
jgi:glycerate dehydrogenase